MVATIFVAGSDWQNLSMQGRELTFLCLGRVMAKDSLVVSYEGQALQLGTGHICIVQPQYDSLTPNMGGGNPVRSRLCHHED